MTDFNKNKKSDNYSDIILSKKTQEQADINEVFVDRQDGTPKLKTGIGAFFSFVNSTVITGIQSTISSLTTSLSTLTGRVEDLENAAPAGPGYSVFTAFLSQAVIETTLTQSILANTLSGPLVWTRAAEGYYIGTLAGAFTTNKTIVNSSLTTTESTTNWVTIYEYGPGGPVKVGMYSFGILNNNQVYLITVDSLNNLIDLVELITYAGKLPLEIKVYP